MLEVIIPNLSVQINVSSSSNQTNNICTKLSNDYTTVIVIALRISHPNSKAEHQVLYNHERFHVHYQC